MLTLKQVANFARRSKIGKKTRAALYVHISALGKLPPELQELEAYTRECLEPAQLKAANVIKFSCERQAITYLTYALFDLRPHPPLTQATLVRYDGYGSRFRSTMQWNQNRPILHRKELLVAEDYPGRDKWKTLTAAEKEAGLLGRRNIGFRKQWTRLLDREGYTIVGHELMRPGY